jgi:hypothetical protein
MDMTPELLPPAKELSLDKKPELKLWHFPLATFQVHSCTT